jgi:hypothetical protein
MRLHEHWFLFWDLKFAEETVVNPKDPGVVYAALSKY